MSEDAIKSVYLRNLFYRDNFHRIVLVLLISIIINVALTGLLVYMATHPPEPRYFATSINGRITPLYPLDEPNQSDAAVLQWANQAAIAAFSYNFVNFRKELQAASDFFTEAGWQQFMSALQESNNLDAVRAKKLVVSAVARKTPIILRKGVLRGRYAWRIQIPLLIGFQSASEYTETRDVVTLLITRVSTLNSPRGIGISQFVVSPKVGG